MNNQIERRDGGKAARPVLVARWKRSPAERIARSKRPGNYSDAQKGSDRARERAIKGLGLAMLMRGIKRVGHWLRHEFDEARPVFLFFLFGFLILLTIVKLVVANLSIEVTAVSKAIIGALFAAKAVLIIDSTPLSRHLEGYRRIIAVAVKTLIYSAITMAIGLVERAIEARHHVDGVGAAFGYVLSHAGIYRLLAWDLGISVVFALYFAFFEINQRMGAGMLRRLFFESPKASGAAGGE